MHLQDFDNHRVSPFSHNRSQVAYSMQHRLKITHRRADYAQHTFNGSVKKQKKKKNHTPTHIENTTIPLGRSLETDHIWKEKKLTKSG